MRPRVQNHFIWPLAGIVLGAICATNPLYQPAISLQIGLAVWLIDLFLMLILSAHSIGLRIGTLLSGVFLAVPCFLRDAPLLRGLLMCLMFFPLAFVAWQLAAPFGTGFRERLGYIFTWLGTREVKRRPRRFEVLSLLHLVSATAALAAAMACVKAVEPAGFWLAVRWFAGGIMIMAFAEMVTGCHNLVTGLLGLTAPALLESPLLSRSMQEFWSKRWNPAASALVFHEYFFEPLTKHVGTSKFTGSAKMNAALFTVFLVSGLGHALLFQMMTLKWGLAFVCGSFFFVQPLLIMAERWMKVRTWSPTAARTWTLGALAAVSPLIVEPVLRVFEPSWGEPVVVFLPTMLVLGFTIVVTVVLVLGTLATCAANGPLSPKAPQVRMYTKQSGNVPYSRF